MNPETRLARDAAELLRCTRAVRRVGVEGMAAFEEVVRTNFGVHVRFVFLVPPEYPAVAPRVYCVEPDVPRDLSLHVYSNGSLCLYQPGEWRRAFTLLDVRNWACEWAFNVIPRVEVGADWMSPEHRP